MTNEMMTKKDATAAALAFIRRVTKPDRHWDVGSVRACLPKGWTLREVDHLEFFPVTVKNVAVTIRHCAVRAP